MEPLSSVKVISLFPHQEQRQKEDPILQETLFQDELNEQLEIYLLELLEKSPLKVKEIEPPEGFTTAKVAGRLYSLLYQGKLLKLERSWCLAPPSFFSVNPITEQTLFNGQKRLKESGCSCRDWVTHICSTRLVGYFSTLFKLTPTKEQLKEIGQSLLKYPLTSPHLEELREFYRKRLRQLEAP